MAQVVHISPDQIENKYDLDLIEKIYIWKQNEKKKDVITQINVGNYLQSDQQKLSSREWIKQFTDPLDLITGQPIIEEVSDYYEPPANTNLPT